MLNVEKVGCADGNQDVYQITLSHKDGLKAVVSNAGASLISLFAPDSNGHVQDLVLGPANPMTRLEPGPMFGVTLGRAAGRTRDARYTHRGQTVHLSPNKKGCHCHGGYRGFDKRVFEIQACAPDRVVMGYTSPDGEEGYPGNLSLTVEYALEGRNLCIRYNATCDADCLVNLSNHIYWNLAGEASGSLAGHTVWLNSRYVARQDQDMILDGTLIPVTATPFDFTHPRRVIQDAPSGNSLFDLIGWYDHDFAIDNRDEPVAWIHDGIANRDMRVYSDRPGFHFYIYSFQNQDFTGKQGQIYSGPCGICVMPMYLPNSANISHWPRPILFAGEKYESTTRFALDW